MLRQLNIHNQVVIPKEYIQALGIQSNDYLEILLEKQKGEIRVRPVCMQATYSASEIRKLKKLFTQRNMGKKALQVKEFLKYLKNL